MFIGHYALGLAAKRAEPSLPLSVLLLAPQLLDLVWPVLVLAGVERFEIEPGNTKFTPLAFTHYPWSHSLVASLAWAALLVLVLRLRRASTRAALVAAALVVSHWVLDFVSHGPDMPLWPGGPRVGLGLWNVVPATIALEVTMFVTGAALYVRTTRARDRIGTWAYGVLVGLLLLIYVANVLGPPPPGVGPVASSALSLWLIPLWGLWIDRHRDPRAASSTSSATISP